MSTTAKPGALKVGEDLAVTPGGVISRDEVAELIQYTPTTKQVYERPTLIVPPPIGRFYFLDLAPGRSFHDAHQEPRLLGVGPVLLLKRNGADQSADRQPCRDEAGARYVGQPVGEALGKAGPTGTGKSEVPTVRYLNALLCHVLALNGLAVGPQRQHRGAGRRLVEAAIGEAQARGAHKLSLRVLGSNTSARLLYEACGFVVEGILRSEFFLNGRYVDDVLMARQLAPEQ